MTARLHACDGGFLVYLDGQPCHCVEMEYGAHDPGCDWRGVGPWQPTRQAAVKLAKSHGATVVVDGEPVPF